MSDPGTEARPEAGSPGCTDDVLRSLTEMGRSLHATPELERVAQVVTEAAVRLQEEHDIALTLQRALLPELPPTPQGVELAVRYLPAVEHAEVGGDWYDVALLSGGRVAVTVGDVEGHSVEAAARMGAVRHALAVCTRQAPNPASALFELDRHLTDVGHNALVTVVHATFDPGSGHLAVARAGHLPPLLVPARGPARFLGGDPSPALGLGLLTRRPRLDEDRLCPGDAAVFFTDGLVERRGIHLDDSMDLLRLAVSERADLSAEAVCDRVVDVLVGSAGADDDVALLVLRAEPARVVA